MSLKLFKIFAKTIAWDSKDVIIRKATKSFQALDINGDGKIDRNEFDTMMYKLFKSSVDEIVTRVK